MEPASLRNHSVPTFSPLPTPCWTQSCHGTGRPLDPPALGDGGRRRCRELSAWGLNGKKQGGPCFVCLFAAFTAQRWSYVNRPLT